MLKDHPERGWIKAERNEKGHFVLDLLSGFPDKIDDAMNASTSESSSTDADQDKADTHHERNGNVPEDSADDDVDDDAVYFITDVSKGFEGVAQQFQDNLYADEVTSSAKKGLAECHAVLDEIERFKVKPRRIWEVFVDEGRTTMGAQAGEHRS